MKYDKVFNLKSGVSKDQLRPALTGAYFTGDHLIVTEGHILAKIRVERTEAEKQIADEQDGVIMPIGALEMYQKGKTKQYDFDEFKITRKNVQVKKPGHTIIFKPITEPYPDYEKVLKQARPASKLNKNIKFIRLAINAGLLKDLADVMGCESVELNIQIDDAGTAPIYVRERIRKDHNQTEPEPNEGVIMPVRID